MGWSRKRTGLTGQVRYTAYYRDARGRTCVAGTFSSKGDADRAWKTAEVRQAEGRLGDPRRGRQTFERYVEDRWLPHHVMEATTREGYTYSIRKHIIPWFGPMRMNQIMPSDVREWVTHLGATGVGPPSIRNLKSILSAIFTTALNDQVTFLHPRKGVKTPTVAPVLLTVVTPEQFEILYQALADDAARLLVETAIESGLRWGELTELRRRDLNVATGMLTVSRVVTEVNPQFHPEGGRFLVREYPKGKKHRRLKLSPHIVAKLDAHARADHLGLEDLFFTACQPVASPPRLKVIPNPRQLGKTAPNQAGRRYQHGTLSGYNAGRCRCANYKAAFAIYRTARRAEGRDSPRTPRTIDTDGHILRVRLPVRGQQHNPGPLRQPRRHTRQPGQIRQPLTVTAAGAGRNFLGQLAAQRARYASCHQDGLVIIPHYPEMTAAAHQASLIILNACAPSDQGTSYPQQAPARAISHIQHWSGWRRCHQGHARHSHYQHRLATELGP